MTKPTFLSADHEAELIRTGFVIVPLLDATAVATLNERLEKTRAVSRQESSIVGQRLAYHSSSLDPDRRYRMETFEAVRDAVADRVASIVDDFEIITAGVLTKEAGTGRIAVHSDWTLTTDARDVTLTIWCPLVDVDQANGCLYLVPGSHRLVRHVHGPGIPDYHRSFQDAVNALSVPVPLKAGTALLFDSTMLHGSPDNKAEVSRTAIMLSCVRRGNQPVYYINNTQAATPTFSMFAMPSDGLAARAAKECFSGSDAEGLMGHVPNRNAPMSFTRFRLRRAFASRWRGTFGQYEPRWVHRLL